MKLKLGWQLAHRIIDVMNGLKYLWAPIAVCVIMQACYYDNIVDLYPDGCQTENVSYNDNIVPILNRECLSCHNSFSEQGGVNLEGYENVLEYVNDGSLLGSIKHEDGYEPMPLSGSKMSNCDIDRIESWINDGAPDN